LADVTLRDVEEAMAARGVLVSSESVRRWCKKFGKQYASRLRSVVLGPVTNSIWTKSCSRSTAFNIIYGAVDQKSVVIDILVQPKCDRFAAMRFLHKLRAMVRRPRVIVTDKMRSY
jgi:putative transposase